MDSQFVQMYLEIMARIKDQVPDISYINFDLGQLENYGERPAVSFPCVLLDFDNFTFSDMLSNSQIAEGTVRVRFAFAPFSNTSSLTPQIAQAKGLNYLEIERKLYKALHGWDGTDFGALMRESVETEKREDDLRVRAMNFSTTFQDNSAGDVFGAVNPVLVINGNTGYLPKFIWEWSKGVNMETQLKITPVGTQTIVEMAINVKSTANLNLQYDLAITGANITEALCPNINNQNGGNLYSPPFFSTEYRYIITVKFLTSLGISGVAYGVIWQDPDGNFTQPPNTDIHAVISAQDFDLPIARTGDSVLIDPS